MSRRLDTARLVLRPFTRQDREALVALYTDPAVMAIRKLGVLDEAASLEQLEAIVAHWESHGFGLYAVFERASGAFAGECGLRWLEDGSEVELSYGLLPPFQGRGLATEAARAVLAEAFSDLALQRVIARSRGDNRVSHRVLEKCGMRLEWRRETGAHGVVQYGIHATPYRTRVVAAHRSSYPDALRLEAGETVAVGASDEEFPGWVWATTGSGKSGWAPAVILEAFRGREESGPTPGAALARVSESYDATELDVDPGLEVEVRHLLGGWARVVRDDGAAGWVPQSSLAHPGAPEEGAGQDGC